MPLHFSDLGVPTKLISVLDRLGLTTPFPIQEATLPDSIAGRDVCGKAPTGSGKTLAFGLAILSRLDRETSAAPKAHRLPRALVLVPTRELALQIEKVIEPLAKALGLNVASIYGGVGYGKQNNALQQGVDILVACPGRLTDLVQQGVAKLSQVSIVVVDEADRMADMGFLTVVRRLIDKTSSSRQTLLFSATLDGPVDKLIRDYQKNPVRHDVKVPDEDKAEVIHHFWSVEGNDRIAITSEAISAIGPAVVFCRTKRGADRLSERLARSGISSAAIHGNRSQNQRERALGDFQAGRLDALVATDIAARGIHVDAVPLVIHFDPPNDATDYVHRSGRTGRAGIDGTVVSLVGAEHQAATAQIQRTLSLPKGITKPNIESLGGGPVRERAKMAPVTSIPDVIVTLPTSKQPAEGNQSPRSRGNTRRERSRGRRS
ncbi:MAG: DEAD/DEAH box helicase [Actinomycetota bacterium]|nr:DEAD/DEAH box helicase [Actinomycetota bacterium]